jgi:hypothetical protein
MHQLRSVVAVVRVGRGALVLAAAAVVLAGVTAVATGTAGAATAKPTAVIVPGAGWSDDGGRLVQAHGAGVLKVGSTFYMVGEDKTAGGKFTAVACYSSPDLVSWTFVGNPLTRQASGDLGPNRIVERPKVIYNSATRMYVMYTHIDAPGYGDARVGVATSSSVCGAYSYRGSFRPLGQLSRDIGLFKDDDGSAYLLSEDRSNGLRIDRLSADCLSVAGSVAVLPDLEAPAMVKVAGRYFLLASHLTGWNTNDNVYATATSLSGPWSSPATFAPVGSHTFNSQTSFIIPVAGSAGTSYVFVADRWISKDLFNSAPVWLPLQISGTTVTLKWYDAWGINIAAGTWTAQTSDTAYEGEADTNTLSGGTRLLDCTGCSGGSKVGYVGHGGTLRFNTITATAAGRYTLKISYTNGDTADRYADVSINGAPTKRMAFPPTGGGTTVKLAVITVDLKAGANTVAFSNGAGWAPDFDKMAVPQP